MSKTKCLILNVENEKILEVMELLKPAKKEKKVKAVKEPKPAKPLPVIIPGSLADFVAKSQQIKKSYTHNGKTSERMIINKGHIRQLVLIGFFGDPVEIVREFNEIFPEKEPDQLVAVDLETAVNEAVGYNWYNPLTKFYAQLEKKYQDQDNYLIVKVTKRATGKSANGFEWRRFSGESTMGDVTIFLGKEISSLPSLKEVVLCRYKKGKGEALTVDWMKLLA